MVGQIEEPLTKFFDADKTQCVCWRGVPTHPDNTVIPGLGTLEISPYILDKNYQEVAVINEPNSLLSILCFSIIFAILKG
jgi:hypothetical protein